MGVKVLEVDIEGVVGLTQWFERMESVFHISNCAVENQVKFATCTLHGIALNMVEHRMSYSCVMMPLTECPLTDTY
ncbi:hypothetical protein Tco_0139453 [Tanacetum coccineum]